MMNSDKCIKFRHNPLDGAVVFGRSTIDNGTGRWLIVMKAFPGVASYLWECFKLKGTSFRIKLSQALLSQRFPL